MTISWRIFWMQIEISKNIYKKQVSVISLNDIISMKIKYYYEIEWTMYVFML